MVLVYFVAFAADEPLDAWALHVRSGDRAVVDGRVSEYVFRAAVAAALFGAALLKAICQAPLSAAGGADAGDKRKGLSLRSNDEGGSWRFPVRRASPSPRAARSASAAAGRRRPSRRRRLRRRARRRRRPQRPSRLRDAAGGAEPDLGIPQY